MALTRRAVIDVGTNSVKLLVADVDEQSVTPVFEESEQTRLGRGFYDTHRLQPDAIADTAKAVAQFGNIARMKNAGQIRVIATSAARDAVNQQELIDAIQRASGLGVEVISGQQEAEWVYQGVRSDPQLRGESLLILDVGGGSTELILGHKAHPQLSHSFALGSVRLLEQFRPSDPPRPEELQRCRDWLKNFFATEVHPVLDAGAAAFQPPSLGGSKAALPGFMGRRGSLGLIGTGGAATILARMEYGLDKYQRHKIEGARITLAAIHRWMEKLWSMPLVERKQIVGLPKKRADVILTGMAIYEAALQELHFTELRASTRGLRFAAVMQR